MDKFDDFGAVYAASFICSKKYKNYVVSISCVKVLTKLCAHVLLNQKIALILRFLGVQMGG